jgi:predicted nucleotidyltransferase
MAELKAIPIEIPQDKIVDYCRRFHVSRLALFGSVLGSDFDSDSDVDVLVTFKPDARVGFLTLSRMQRELTQILGRSVDLIPESGLKPLIRDEVISSSRVIYAT